MSWPDINDYNEALQNLSAVCGDPLLKQCEAVRNPLGLLLPYAGGFADVYAVKSPDGRMWAVKCFKKHRPELHERYELIDAHLKSVKLPFTVPFAYVPRGLQIRGEWYPIVRMEWVEGLRLNDFVADSFEKPQMFDQLAELWPKVAQRLQAANLAHADLQHGNVLLVPRGEDGSLSLKLIDYDGMFVPAFAGQRSGELGHKDFQHPQRAKEKVFNADVDRFSHLVIYTALRSLRVAGKDLWQRFENGDNLLFRESDFLAPAKSPLLGELWRINHPAAHAMTGRLVLATQQPLAAAPWLHEVVQGREVKPLTPQEEGRVQELLGKSAPAKTFASAETIETAAPGTRPGTQPAPMPAGGTRPGGPPTPAAGGGARPPQRPVDPLNPLGKPQGDLLKPPEPEEPLEEPLGPILWKLYRQNLLLANVGIVGALTLLILVGAMLFSGGPEKAPSPPVDPTIAQADGSPRQAVIPDFRQLRTLRIHEYAVGSLVFNSGGLTITSGGGEGTAKIWDTTTGQVQKSFSGADVAVSADGRKLLVWNRPNISIIDPASGTVLQSIDTTINGVSRDARSIAIRADGTQIALGAGNSVQIWDASAGILLRTLTDIPGDLYDVAYSPSGDALAAVGDFAFVGVWDANTGVPRWRQQSPDPLVGDVMCVAFSPDGRVLATNGLPEDAQSRPFTSTIVLRDAATGEIRRMLAGHDAGLIMALEFSPDGAFMASGSQDKTAKVWNLAADELLQTLSDLPDQVRSLAISADSRTIAIGCDNGEVSLWHNGTAGSEAAPSTSTFPQYELARTMPGHVVGINAAAVSPDSSLIATCSGDSTVRLWDAATGAQRQTLGNAFAGDPVSSVAFSPDASTLVAGRNGTLELWNTATGELRQSLYESSGLTTDLAYSPSGLMLAARVGNTAQVWHVPSGTQRYALTSQETEITALAVSTDGQALITGCRSGELIVFNFATGDSTLQIKPGLPGEVRALACLPQSPVFAAATTDGQVYFFDFTTGNSLGTLPAHSRAIEVLVYRPDGRVLATLDNDGLLKLWDTATAQLRQEIPLGVGNQAVAFSPDGLLLVTSDNNTNSVVVWSLPAGAEAPAQQSPATPPDEAMAEQSSQSDSETLVDPFGADPAGAPRPGPRPTPPPVVPTALPQYQAAQTLQRHPGYVFTLAFRPNGRQLASGGSEATLMLWDAATGEFERQAGFHSGSVFATAYSPDGTLLASSGDDSVIELWNVETFASRELPRLHTGRVLDLAFSPDGQRLASCGEDRVVILWDIATGDSLFQMRGHEQPIRSVAFSPDGQMLASSSADGQIWRWEAATGTFAGQLGDHTDDVWSLAFSPDGRTLASASADLTIKLWNFATGELESRLLGHTDRIFAVAYSPDGSLLASGSADGTVKLWNAATGELSQTLIGHQAGVYAVAFSPDGATLASSGYEPTIHLWRVEGSPAAPAAPPSNAPGPLPAGPVEFQEARRFRVHTAAVRGLAFVDGGRTLVSAGLDSKVNFLDPATGEVRADSAGLTLPIVSLAGSPSGFSVAAGDDTSQITLWDSMGGNHGALEDHSAAVRALAYSPDERYLASGSDDRSLIVWNLVDREPLFKSNLHRGSVLSVAYSPDGQTLASGSEDHTIGLWNATTGQALSMLTDHKDDVNCVAFSPDGATLASCSKDRTIRLWDFPGGTLRQTLTGHKAPVMVVAYSPDGRWLASGGGDDDVRIWNAATGELVQTLTGHKSTVFALAFTPDSQTLASGSLDRSIILWQLAPSGAGAAPDAAIPADDADFSPDGPGRAQGRQSMLMPAGAGADAAAEFQVIVARQLRLPVREESAVGLALQLIPAGKFQMGSPDSEPSRSAGEQQHNVELTKPFYLSATEVTRGQFEQFFPNWEGERLGPLAGHENDAQSMVGWADACAFCNALSEREGLAAYYTIEGRQTTVIGGLGYRLPTEAEMEYVCRCGTNTAYYQGHDVQAIAAYRANASLPHAVALAQPNAWGLYDLYGSVWEWCEDWYSAPYLATVPLADPRGPDSGEERVLRGGCSAANGEWMRCAARNKAGQTYDRQNSIGFRVARTVHE